MRLVNPGKTIAALALMLTVGLLVTSSPTWAAFVFGEPTKMSNISLRSASYPQISRDGLELYFKAEEVGQCGDIWVIRRTSTRDPWSAPVRLDFPVNSAGPECAPCMSSDGLELYFSDAVYGTTACQPDPGGYGQGDLWVCKRATREDPWDRPENLGPTVNTNSVEDSPSLSADGLSLYFHSWRLEEGYGYYDLYVTTRTSKVDPWESAESLGQPVNSSLHESTPFISPDGLSLFFSAGAHQLPYVTDIYVSRRETVGSPWGPPALFAPVQIPGLENSLCFSEKDSTLYFSNSSDFYGPYDLWQVKVTPVLDFNGDGAVDNQDITVLAQDWGAIGSRMGPPPTSPCDIAPLPFGDGVVDAKNLLVLAEYMASDMAQVSDVNRP
jgi:hypothetical protein